LRFQISCNRDAKFKFRTNKLTRNQVSARCTNAIDNSHQAPHIDFDPRVSSSDERLPTMVKNRSSNADAATIMGRNESSEMNDQRAAPTTSILVVDDDEVLRTRLKMAFERRGLSVFCADGFDGAVLILNQVKPNLAVIDLKVPGKSGIELLIELRKLSPHTKAVILTGYGSISNAVDAIKLGAVNYVPKPADADQLLAAFEVEPQTNLPQLAPPSLAQSQWEHIQRVLSECGGNITEAAQILDIPRRTLQRKLKKMLP
jgi:two-component system response regulator RegA